MAEEFLRIENLVKTFGTTTVVKGFDLGFDKGEFVSFLGPSGCGKTTVLRMIAGFELPTSGRIIVEDRDITGLNPNQRQIGMVFQAYALFPNMNVAGNIGFGLKVQGASRHDIDARVDEMLELIGLKGFGKRFPFELSGANSSASHWHAPSRRDRECCCSTSRSRHSTPRFASHCASKSGRFSVTSGLRPSL